MDVLSDLLAEATSDPTRNPWLFLSEKVRRLYYPPTPWVTVKQLYFIAALLGVVAVLTTVSLALRIHKRIFWLFRIDAGLIRPHATIPWSLLGLFTVIFLEVMVAFRIYLLEGRPPYATGYVILSVWCWVWLTGYVAIYSIATSLVVHLRASGRNVQTWTILTNVVGLGVPLVFLCIELPVSLVAGHAWGAAIRHHDQIQRVLLAAAEEWSPGAGLDLSLLLDALPIVDEISANLDRIASLRLLYYVTFDVGCGLALLADFIVGGTYVFYLKRSLSMTMVDTGGSLNEAQKRLKRTMNNLILMLISLTLVQGTSFAYCFYGSFPPAKQSVEASTTLAILPLYIFSVFGVPCSFLLARGAWCAQKKDVGHGSSQATQGQTSWMAKVANAARRTLLRRTSHEEPVTVVSHAVFSRKTTLTVVGQQDGEEEKNSEERTEVDVNLRRKERGSFDDEKKLNELPEKLESIV